METIAKPYCVDLSTALRKIISNEATPADAMTDSKLGKLRANSIPLAQKMQIGELVRACREGMGAGADVLNLWEVGAATVSPIMQARGERIVFEVGPRSAFWALPDTSGTLARLPVLDRPDWAQVT